MRNLIGGILIGVFGTLLISSTYITPIVRLDMRDRSLKWEVFNSEVVVDVVKDTLMLDYFYLQEGTEHWCCAGYKE